VLRCGAIGCSERDGSEHRHRRRRGKGNGGRPRRTVQKTDVREKTTESQSETGVKKREEDIEAAVHIEATVCARLGCRP